MPPEACVTIRQHWVECIRGNQWPDLILPRSSAAARAARPYPARQRREVEAVSGWRLGTHSGNPPATRHPELPPAT